MRGMAGWAGETPTSAWPGMSPRTPKRSQIASACPRGSRTKLTSTKRLRPGPAPCSWDVPAAGTPAKQQQDPGCRSVEREASGTPPGSKVGGHVSPSPAHRSMPKNRPPRFLFPKGSRDKPCSGCRRKLLSPCPPPMPARGGGRATTAGWLELALKPATVTPRRHRPCPERRSPSATGEQAGQHDLPARAGNTARLEQRGVQLPLPRQAMMRTWKNAHSGRMPSNKFIVFYYIFPFLHLIPIPHIQTLLSERKLFVT